MNKNIFEFTIQKRFPDFDAQGVLNNAVLHTYFETAHLSFFIDHHNLKWKKDKIPVLLKKIEIEYLNKILNDFEYKVSVNITSIGNSSIHLELNLYDEDRLHYASAKMLLIYYNWDKNQKEKISKEIVNKLLNN